jgi:L-ascorbate metabolism protein UlaG (beta-lactamase superfamily)
MSLMESRFVTGSLIAMSVFYAGWFPPVENAKNYAYYLYHSPTDDRCKFSLAEEAAKVLKEKGAQVNLVTYKGGHGWSGSFYQDIAKGMRWIDEKAVLDEKTVIRSLRMTGFRVETPKHSLIFDPVSILPREGELGEKNVVIFISGAKEGQLLPAVFRKYGALKNARFVIAPEVADSGDPKLKKALGAMRGSRPLEIKAGEKKKVGAVTVRGVQGACSGMGYVVEVDGVILFHAGGGEPSVAGLPPDLGLPSKMKVDAAFLPIDPESCWKWSVDAVRRNLPRIVIPMQFHNRTVDPGEFVREIEGLDLSGVQARLLANTEDAVVVRKP